MHTGVSGEARIDTVGERRVGSMVHCPECDATLERQEDVEFGDMGAESGFFEASERFYLVACGDCGAAIGSGVAGAR